MEQERSPADSPTTSALGPRRLANRYRLETLIGEGRTGVVYAAVDEMLGRAVAVKLVRIEQVRGGDGLEQFTREARAAVSLTHRHIVTLHDFGIDEGGAPYLVMERLFGRSLRAALRADKRFAVDRALGILQGVAAALDAAHDHGIVHRDLKPENIFLTRMLEMSRPADSQAANSNFASASIEVPKVLDFAAAPGVLAGTVAYMSPEQLAGGKPQPAWDVWSLAVIVYEMLSGVHPIGPAAGRGGMPMSRPVAIRSVVRHLPEDADALFDRVLALEARWRPATASVLVAELRKALSTVN